MHRLAVRRLSVNAFPKRPGANFIPLTPLAFIDRARHVSRVLHVFTRGSARHVVAASMA